MKSILKGLQQYADKNYISMHMPGHKSGKVLPDQIRDLFGEKVFTYDITELPGMDNLQNPTGIIRETEKKIGRVTKSAAAILLVNGSTVGLLAAVYAVARRQEVFVAANCHQSVHNGILLAESWPIFINTINQCKAGSGSGISPQDLQEAINRYPDCKVLIITSPDYYGRRGYLKDLMAIAKANRITVIVDEAHGAHLGMIDGCYPSAIECGADLVVQSWHKMLPVLNQGSVLLLGDNKWEASIRQAVNIFQTTSPSYLIMATLDAAADMLIQKKEEITLMADIILSIKQQTFFKNISVFNGKKYKDDPYKIWVRSRKLLKQHADTIIRDRYRIEPEIVADHELLFLLPLFSTRESVDILFKALIQLDDILTSENESFQEDPVFIKEAIRKVKKKPSDLSLSTIKMTSLEMAEGFTAAQKVVAYPPGVPIIFPGETVTKEMICYLLKHKLHYNLQDGIAIYSEQEM